MTVALLVASLSLSVSKICFVSELFIHFLLCVLFFFLLKSITCCAPFLNWNERDLNTAKENTYLQVSNPPFLPSVRFSALVNGTYSTLK